MMTEKEVNTFIELEAKIQDTCNHIATIFKDMDSDFEEPTWWEYDDGSFYGSGCSISKKWLWATDEELRQHVQDTLEQRRQWQEARRIMEQQEIEQRKLERQQRLEKYCTMTREELLSELGVPKDMLEVK